MSSEKKITLQSSDGETFEVEERVALELQSIKHIVEDDSADNVIPLPNVTGNILAKVIEYCTKHVEYAARAETETSTTDAPAVVDDHLNSWDADFVNVDDSTLFDLALASKYLNIKSLIDLIYQTVSNKIKGKTPEEIRKTFNIKNDYTPEEEEEIRWEYELAFG